MDGIFNVLKPPGMTSHDVVGALRKILNMKKIGHGGTLDPLAAGVLPVFTGIATRFLEYAAHEEKSYRAELTFGFQTDTGDTEGKVIAQSPVRPLTDEEIEAALASFRGEGTQIPPMYSAISVGGTKLYKLARQGIEVKREPRPITLYELEKVDYTGDTLVFDVTCSKGTFIRTLCEDLAEKLGMKAPTEGRGVYPGRVPYPGRDCRRPGRVLHRGGDGTGVFPQTGGEQSPGPADCPGGGHHPARDPGRYPVSAVDPGGAPGGPGQSCGRPAPAPQDHPHP